MCEVQADNRKPSKCVRLWCRRDACAAGVRGTAGQCAPLPDRCAPYHAVCAVMERVTSQLYVGNQGDGCNWQALRTEGITAVCNLTEYEFGAADAGFTTLWLQHPDGELIPTEKIDRFMDWMAERERAGEQVLIHCQAGVSRTRAFAIAWLVWSGGVGFHTDLATKWSTYQDIIGRIRPIIMPHALLKKSLIEWLDNHRN